MQLFAKRVCLQLTTSPTATVVTWMSRLDACTPTASPDRVAHARMLAATLVGFSFAGCYRAVLQLPGADAAGRQSERGVRRTCERKQRTGERERSESVMAEICKNAGHRAVPFLTVRGSNWS